MKELSILRYERTPVQAVLDNEEWRLVQQDWLKVKAKIETWWRAYKKWEAKDTFEAAYTDKRMSVRTFGNDFQYQLTKTFGRGEIKPPDNRFHADSKYTRLDRQQQTLHSNAFRDPLEHQKYWARRGIDSSAFAVPANFLTRDKKYDEGLHDLSASMINPALSIFDQIHNSEDGANFSFLPISEEEDQEILYNLGRCASALKQTLPDMYILVRSYRAEMTRIKLAQELDMAIGYTVVPIQNYQGTGPKYKLRYGLGNTLTVPGGPSISVTAKVLEARQKAARKFKSIIGVRDGKNEVLIAIRKHAGGFPMLAVRDQNKLYGYNIVGNQMVMNGVTISSMGKIGHVD